LTSGSLGFGQLFAEGLGRERLWVLTGVEAGDGAGEVGTHVDVGQAGAFDERVHSCAPGAGVFAANEKVVLAADGDLPHIALNGVVVDGHAVGIGKDAQFIELVGKRGKGGANRTLGAIQVVVAFNLVSDPVEGGLR
jgi:hypothetical protein